MKKNILILMLLIAINSYSNTNPNMSKYPHYKVPLTNEFAEAIEQKGYNDFLRIVDEQNRKNGIISNYTNKATKKESRLHDNVDLVPVAHVVDSSDRNDWKYELERLKSPISDSDAGRSYQRTEKLITEGVKSISSENFEKMGYERSGYQNRFYLGNGNTVKDIIYLSKDNFSKEVQKAKDTNNDRFLIEGAYKSIGSRNDDPDTYPNEKETNILGIKVDATKNAKGEYTDEYYAKIQGKSRKEVAAFLKSKMEEKGITGIIQKGDELYTKDSKGNEWKVLWSLEPISLHKSSAPENERFKDTVFTRIFTYNEFDDNSTTDSAGKKLYTKDGSIYLQDKYDYSPKLLLKDGWGEPKKLSDKIAEAKENIDNGELPSNTFEHYFYDKKNMTEADFNAKWVTPFENGQFDNDLANLKKEDVYILDKLSNKYSKKRFFSSVSCIGSTICNPGILDTPPILEMILKYFKNKQRLASYLPKIQLSGCPNSCAAHQIAELGFQGKRKKDGAYFNVFIGGEFKTKDVVTLNKSVGELKAETIPLFLEEMAKILKERKITYEIYSKQDDFIDLVKKFEGVI